MACGGGCGCGGCEGGGRVLVAGAVPGELRPPQQEPVERAERWGPAALRPGRRSLPEAASAEEPPPTAAAGTERPEGSVVGAGPGGPEAQARSPGYGLLGQAAARAPSSFELLPEGRRGKGGGEEVDVNAPPGAAPGGAPAGGGSPANSADPACANCSCECLPAGPPKPGPPVSEGTGGAADAPAAFVPQAPPEARSAVVAAEALSAPGPALELLGLPPASPGPATLASAAVPVARPILLTTPPPTLGALTLGGGVPGVGGAPGGRPAPGSPGRSRARAEDADATLGEGALGEEALGTASSGAGRFSGSSMLAPPTLGAPPGGRPAPTAGPVPTPTSRPPPPSPKPAAGGSVKPGPPAAGTPAPGGGGAPTPVRPPGTAGGRVRAPGEAGAFRPPEGPAGVASSRVAPPTELPVGSKGGQVADPFGLGEATAGVRGSRQGPARTPPEHPSAGARPVLSPGGSRAQEPRGRGPSQAPPPRRPGPEVRGTAASMLGARGFELPVGSKGGGPAHPFGLDPAAVAVSARAQARETPSREQAPEGGPASSRPAGGEARGSAGLAPGVVLGPPGADAQERGQAEEPPAGLKGLGAAAGVPPPPAPAQAELLQRGQQRLEGLEPRPPGSPGVEPAGPGLAVRAPPSSAPPARGGGGPGLVSRAASARIDASRALEESRKAQGWLKEAEAAVEASKQGGAGEPSLTALLAEARAQREAEAAAADARAADKAANALGQEAAAQSGQAERRILEEVERQRSAGAQHRGFRDQVTSDRLAAQAARQVRRAGDRAVSRAGPGATGRYVALRSALASGAAVLAERTQSLDALDRRHALRELLDGGGDAQGARRRELDQLRGDQARREAERRELAREERRLERLEAKLVAHVRRHGPEIVRGLERDAARLASQRDKKLKQAAATKSVSRKRRLLEEAQAADAESKAAEAEAKALAEALASGGPLLGNLRANAVVAGPGCPSDAVERCCTCADKSRCVCRSKLEASTPGGAGGPAAGGFTGTLIGGTEAPDASPGPAQAPGERRPEGSEPGVSADAAEAGQAPAGESPPAEDPGPPSGWAPSDEALQELERAWGLPVWERVAEEFRLRAWAEGLWEDAHRLALDLLGGAAGVRTPFEDPLAALEQSFLARVADQMRGRTKEEWLRSMLPEDLLARTAMSQEAAHKQALRAYAQAEFPTGMHDPLVFDVLRRGPELQAYLHALRPEAPARQEVGRALSGKAYDERAVLGLLRAYDRRKEEALRVRGYEPSEAEKVGYVAARAVRTFTSGGIDLMALREKLGIPGTEADFLRALGSSGRSLATLSEVAGGLLAGGVGVGVLTKLGLGSVRAAVVAGGLEGALGVEGRGALSRGEVTSFLAQFVLGAATGWIGGRLGALGRKVDGQLAVLAGLERASLRQALGGVLGGALGGALAAAGAGLAGDEHEITLEGLLSGALVGAAAGPVARSLLRGRAGINVGSEGAAAVKSAMVRPAARAGKPLPIPGVPWRYAKPGELNPGEFGSTSWKGDIIVRRGLSPQLEAETIRHEAVHRFLTPLGEGGVASFRQGARAWFYNKSVIMRVLEEGAAETYATRSLAKGLSLPFGGGYSLAPGLGDAALLGGIGGVAYVATRKPEGSR